MMNYELNLENKKNIRCKKLINSLFISISLLLLSVLISTRVSAAINNTMNFQTKMVVKSSGLNVTSGTPPTCVVAGADTCDFRVRIWNVSSGGTATAGNNLLFEELFTNIELGDSNGIFNIVINSVCEASASSLHAWGSTIASSSVCVLLDDNGDADSTTGVNFNRDDLYLEITFDPSGAWTTLASPPGGIETFERTNLASAPSAFSAQTINGVDSTGFVQLSPSSVQNTSSSTDAIRVNQQGAGDIMLLERTMGGQNVLKLDNNGQLTIGATAGIILLGGDTNLYRETSTSQKTDDNFVVGDGLFVTGLTDVFSNLNAQVTISNGSTTTTGSGTSTNLTVASTTNFNVGNLILVNGATYARIVSIDSSNLMVVNPSLSWTNGNTVVEYTSPKIGGDGTDISLQFDKIFAHNGFRVGTSSGSSTTYSDQKIITEPEANFNINAINKDVQLNSNREININTTDGLIINDNEQSNTTPAWNSPAVTSGGTARYGLGSVVYNGIMYSWGGNTSGNSLYSYNLTSDTWSYLGTGGTARYHGVMTAYNNKIYMWGGWDGVTHFNSLVIYNIETNTWTTGASGGTGRRAPVYLEYNGKLYIWGGYNGVYLTTMDVYDFETDTWSVGTAGGSNRFDAKAVLYDNKMYIWGGFDGFGVYLNTMDFFDFNTGTWNAGISGGTGRNSHTAVVYNNKMYIWGGWEGTTHLNTMDIFDFATGSWSTGTTGGTARRITSSVVYNNKWYIYGGLTASVSVNTLDVFDFGVHDKVFQISVNSVETLSFNHNNVLKLSSKPLGLRYIVNDMAQYVSGSWSAPAAGGTARYGHTTVEYNGKLYTFGGSNSGSSTIYTTVDIYDIATGTYSTGASAATGRWLHQAVVYNNLMYVITGRTTSAATSAVNTVDIYNLDTNSWTTGASGGTAKGWAMAVLYNRRIYVWGGQNSASTNINTLDIYDISTNSWSTGTAGGTARRGGQAVVYREKMYIWGGYTAAVVNTMDIYNFVTNTWIAGTNGGTARFGSNVAVVYEGQMYTWGGCTDVSCATTINTASSFDFTSNTWTTTATALTGGTTRGFHSAVLYKNKIYTWGGLSASTPINSMNVFNFGDGKVQDVFYISNESNQGSDSGRLFRFDTSGRAFTSKQGGWFSVGADYAEYMHTNDISIEAGDIVKLDIETANSILKAKDGDSPIGVISSEPGFVGNITSIEDINNNRSDMKLMSMVGQVPVKVIGEISVGDKITVSNIEGIGRRAVDGEDNIGIAQESFNGDGVGRVSVLITRNNEGVNNKVEIKLGKKGSGGFRLSGEGKIQFRNANEEWMDMDSQVVADSSVIWKRIGKNIYNNNKGVISVGVSEELLSDSKLQVQGSIEAIKGENYIKLNAEDLKISFSSNEVGIRLSNNSLQFKDNITNEWKDFSALVISTSKINKGRIDEVKDTESVSGWGYIQGDGTNTSIMKLISLGKEFKDVPVVIVDISGSLKKEPKGLNECVYDDSIVTITPFSIDSKKFNLNLKTYIPTEINKYYCFSWRAVGEN